MVLSGGVLKASLKCVTAEESGVERVNGHEPGTSVTSPHVQCSANRVPPSPLESRVVVHYV